MQTHKLVLLLELHLFLQVPLQLLYQLPPALDAQADGGLHVAVDLPHELAIGLENVHPTEAAVSAFGLGPPGALEGVFPDDFGHAVVEFLCEGGQLLEGGEGESGEFVLNLIFLILFRFERQELLL
jgi:hypothetical protein